MADPNLIATNVKMGSDFKGAARIQPVLSIQVKPDAVTSIISNLDKLKDRTDDSEIVKSCGKYSFMDKRNNQPLAELDSHNGMLTLYKSPKDMAERIDSAFISTKTINDFIATSRVPEISASATPVATVKIASR